MKVSTFLNLFLLIGVLTLDGPAFADSKDEATFQATEKAAEHVADVWKSKTGDWLKTPANIADGPMKKKEITGFNNNASKGLTGKKCRDEAQADSIAAYFQKKFDGLQENIEPKVTFAITVHCVKGTLTGDVRFEKFGLSMQHVSVNGYIDPYGCADEQLRSAAGRACLNLGAKEMGRDKSDSGGAGRALVCNKGKEPQCCHDKGNKKLSDCIPVSKLH